MSAKATPFSTMAGSTTVVKRRPKGISAPITKMAADRKMVPERTVPAAQRAMATGSLTTTFFKIKTKAKKTNAVMNLSMIFGKNPPGKVENNPEMTPVVTASKNTDFTFGNKRIPINIIVSIKSGFIPPLNPGITT